MSLREDQNEFARYFAILIIWINDCYGYSVSIGDVWAKDGHIKGSFHYLKLAGDLNLYKHGVYQRSTEAHKVFGEFWEDLHPKCTWGGRFRKKDGNHYSWGEKR